MAAAGGSEKEDLSGAGANLFGPSGSQARAMAGADAAFDAARDYNRANSARRRGPEMPAKRRRKSDAIEVGAWRSLVAHTLGVRVVAGSNPAAPTNI